MNDPMTMLKKDHKEAKALLKELADSSPGRERERTLKELEAALTLHMEIEERLVYPMVQKAEGREVFEEADTEHRLAREGLQKARELVAAPGFGAVIDMLTAGINHHVQEEEKEVLPRLKERTERDDWMSLGDRMAEMKESSMPATSRAR